MNVGELVIHCVRLGPEQVLLLLKENESEIRLFSRLLFFSFLSCAARYQNELAGVEAEQLAERFYHQALSVSPTVGEKHHAFTPVTASGSISSLSTRISSNL